MEKKFDTIILFFCFKSMTKQRNFSCFSFMPMFLPFFYRSLAMLLSPALLPKDSPTPAGSTDLRKQIPDGLAIRRQKNPQTPSRSIPDLWSDTPPPRIFLFAIRTAFDQIHKRSNTSPGSLPTKPPWFFGSILACIPVCRYLKTKIPQWSPSPNGCRKY